jgi:hypothetical protein
MANITGATHLRIMNAKLAARVEAVYARGIYQKTHEEIFVEVQGVMMKQIMVRNIKLVPSSTYYSNT